MIKINLERNGKDLLKLTFLYLSETLCLNINEEQNNTRNVTCYLVSCLGKYSVFHITEKGTNLAAESQE